ncbi:MAG: helix-turn-helix transcriptional regulator [Clostridia bacterium]|nr:helix-turn-helix transcriptional regulator [Clostridia bacterium]
MKTRKIEIGDKNIVGQKIAKIRIEKGLKQKDFIAQIQTSGLDMNPSSYSKLEGQFRSATDKELYIISKLLNVDINELFEP